MALLRRTCRQAIVRSVKPLLRAVTTYCFCKVSATDRRISRIKNPIEKVLIVMAGIISCCQEPEPEAGSQCKVPAKTIIKITPSQKDGTEIASKAKKEATMSNRRPLD